MGKCPYCGAVVHLKDFFDKQPVSAKRDAYVSMQEGIETTRDGTAHMWVCPKCDKILGFSERSNPEH